MDRDKRDRILCCLIGIYITALIGITFCHRMQNFTYQILTPLWSYRSILQGDIQVLVEDIENILLFLPCGFTLQHYLKTEKKRVCACGFCIAFMIEILQLVTRLGCFEIDDLINNSLGCCLGTMLYEHYPLKIDMPYRTQLQWILRAMMVNLILITMVIFLIDLVKQPYRFHTSYGVGWSDQVGRGILRFRRMSSI